MWNSVGLGSMSNLGSRECKTGHFPYLIVSYFCLFQSDGVRSPYLSPPYHKLYFYLHRLLLYNSPSDISGLLFPRFLSTLISSVFSMISSLALLSARPNRSQIYCYYSFTQLYPWYFWNPFLYTYILILIYNSIQSSHTTSVQLNVVIISATFILNLLFYYLTPNTRIRTTLFGLFGIL